MIEMTVKRRKEQQDPGVTSEERCERMKSRECGDSVGVPVTQAMQEHKAENTMYSTLGHTRY